MSNQNHKDLIGVSRIILGVLRESGSPMSHTNLQREVGPRWWNQEERELSNFNQAIGYLIDRKRIHRQALGKGMKYSIRDKGDK